MTVSVIIPTYNRAQLLGEAIDSVLAQTYEDYEIIVVDDGSTDNTLDIVSRYGGAVRYFSQTNGGPASARNLGIARAVGRYIALLDSDDVLLPDCLECHITAAASYDHKPVLWFSDHKTLLPDGTVLPSRWTSKRKFRPSVEAGAIGVLEQPSAELATGCFFSTAGLLLARAAVEGAGSFRAELGPGDAEDFDLYVRLGRQGSFGYTNRALSIVRRHCGNSDQLQLSSCRTHCGIYCSLIQSGQLDKQALQAAKRNWRKWVGRAHKALLRESKPGEARQELRRLPKWWLNPRFLLKWAASFLFPVR